MSINNPTKKPLPMLAEDKDARGLLKALKQGANPNQRNSTGKTALHYAAVCWKQRFISKLIEFGCNPRLKDIDGFLPLHNAVATQNFSVINVLIQNGGNINTRVKNGLAPIHMSIITRDLKILRMLVNHGADLNIKDGSDGTTPQELAHIFGFAEGISFLNRRATRQKKINEDRG